MKDKTKMILALSLILVLFGINRAFTLSLLVDQRVSYELKIIDLKQDLREAKSDYTHTITKIVENIKLSDSYLFTGGLDEQQENETSLQDYEEILLMNEDFSGLLTNVENFFDERTEYLSKIPNIFPVEYSPDNRITSLFGKRISPITGKIIIHNGIDIMSHYGAKILATADGVVHAYYPNHWLYGRYLIIKHADGYYSHYAHLDDNFVLRGEVVKQGDVIGIMGNSGTSFGIHLHYMITKNGEVQNPIFFLRREEV